MYRHQMVNEDMEQKTRDEWYDDYESAIAYLAAMPDEPVKYINIGDRAELERHVYAKRYVDKITRDSAPTLHHRVQALSLFYTWLQHYEPRCEYNDFGKAADLAYWIKSQLSTLTPSDLQYSYLKSLLSALCSAWPRLKDHPYYYS